MRAAIVKNINPGIRATHHDHGLTSDLHRYIVAGGSDLGFMSAVDPDLFPDALDLPIEQRLIGVDAAVDAVWLDKIRNRQDVYKRQPEGRSMGFFRPSRA